MISLYLARHGQTEENIARIFQGHLPGRLTVEGISQAEVLRDSLKRIPLDAVVSSDLKRCMDTAEIVMEGRELPWETTSLLREIDWGSWTGLRLSLKSRTRRWRSTLFWIWSVGSPSIRA